jgi:hypothetical protein
MANASIEFIEPDPTKLATLRQCMENYDVGSSEAEWPNNMLSRRTVVYASGVISRQGMASRHAVDPNELALCQRLAAEAAQIMESVDVGMGSESSDPFQEFYIAATVDEPIPQTIDEVLVRSRFGGAIFPPATITIEPMDESGIWWAEVLQDGSESDDAYFVPWRKMMKWFRDQPAFTDSAFIRVGDSHALLDLDKENYPEGTEITGSALPRLALGLTRNGSLVGLFGFSVQT